MKENAEGNNKKKIKVIGCLSIILVIVLILLIPGVLNRDKTNSQEQVILMDTETMESSATENDKVADKDEEKELYLMDYKDLVDKQITNGYITGKDDSTEGNKGSESNSKDDSLNNKKNTEDSVDIDNSSADKTVVKKEEGVTIVDESPGTIKDETVQNVYKENENQNSIEFFDVEPEGQQPNGDVPAGGKQDVGTWN